MLTLLQILLLSFNRLTLFLWVFIRCRQFVQVRFDTPYFSGILRDCSVRRKLSWCCYVQQRLAQPQVLILHQQWHNDGAHSGDIPGFWNGTGRVPKAWEGVGFGWGVPFPNGIWKGGNAPLQKFLKNIFGSKWWILDTFSDTFLNVTKNPATKWQSIFTANC